MDAAQTYPDKVQESSFLKEIIEPVTEIHEHKPYSHCDRTENYLRIVI
jgi:hypothetical protein